jgi:threonine/homoserine/homoserine lactone efflux protein
MPLSLLLSAAIAGAIVVLTPGPAVIALLGIGAGQGRRAGAAFIIGHLAGDLMWSALALVALVGANVLAPWVFQALASFCGLYLFWLGARAVLVRRREAAAVAAHVRRPLRRGLVFGLSNPKSYPVTLSVFTALLAGDLGSLASCFVGFLAADALLIWLVGTAPLRRLYRRHELWLVRLTGVLFIGFAVNTLLHAWQGWQADPAR